MLLVLGKAFILIKLSFVSKGGKSQLIAVYLSVYKCCCAFSVKLSKHLYKSNLIWRNILVLLMKTFYHQN